MKHALEIRANALYFHEQKEGNIQLNPKLELVLIHSDGYEYFMDRDNKEFEKAFKIVETRLIVSPEMISDLIIQLKVHQENLNNLRANADNINALIKNFNT